MVLAWLDGAPVAVRRDDQHLADLRHGLLQRQQPRRVDPIVVGY
jgi:hypothetical protein